VSSSYHDHGTRLGVTATILSLAFKGPPCQNRSFTLTSWMSATNQKHLQHRYKLIPETTLLRCPARTLDRKSESFHVLLRSRVFSDRHLGLRENEWRWKHCTQFLPCPKTLQNSWQYFCIVLPAEKSGRINP
jgi:hypothetical protein